MAALSAVQVREVLKLEAKKARQKQQAKAAGLSEADVAPLIAEIDADIAKIKNFAAAQSEIPTDKSAKK